MLLMYACMEGDEWVDGCMHVLSIVCHAPQTHSILVFRRGGARRRCWTLVGLVGHAGLASTPHHIDRFAIVAPRGQITTVHRAPNLMTCSGPALHAASRQALSFAVRTVYVCAQAEVC